MTTTRTIDRTDGEDGSRTTRRQLYFGRCFLGIGLNVLRHTIKITIPYLLVLAFDAVVGDGAGE